MSDVVFRIVLPVFWLSVIIGVAANRRRVLSQLGHDPIVVRPWQKRQTAEGYLEWILAVCSMVLTVDIALNAVFPRTIAATLAIEVIRSSKTVGSLGLVLLTVGLVQAGIAVRHMGVSWRVGIDKRTSGPLVSQGLFSRVRHPIYGGMLLATAGLTAVMADLLTIGVAAAVWIALPVQARLEENFLRSRYPEEYPPYMGKTGRFWPKVAMKNDLSNMETPQFLLIARERLRAGSEEAYDQNELKLAAVCATLKCPHPYLALASVAGPKEVWWLNAFASREERDGLDAAYARNEPLMAAMRPLGKRKEDFRESFITTMTEFRRDLSGGAMLRIAGSRFLIVDSSPEEDRSASAVFESSSGERFVIASATNRAAAEDIGRTIGRSAMILEVQPQWSFPAPAWVDADPGFWKVNTAARQR